MASPRHSRAERGGRPRRRGLVIGLATGGGVVAIAAIALAVGLSQTADGPACAGALPAAFVVAGSAGQVSGSGAQTATHYQLDGVPNCSYPAPPADGLYAALPTAEYASAATCGGYLRVTGPHGTSVQVKVVDQCPDCAAGHIDLSDAAFAKLAPLSAGLIDVRYSAVSDPVLPGPVTVQVKDGSSRYWLALLPDNTGNALASVAVRSGSGWLSLARASYNYWIGSSGAGPGPFTVRLTDTAGNQVTLNGITLSPGVTQRTASLMYGAAGQPGLATPAAAAPGTSTPAGSPRASLASLTPTAVRSVAPAASTVRPAAPASGAAAGPPVTVTLSPHC
jgi:expansin